MTRRALVEVAGLARIEELETRLREADVWDVGPVLFAASGIGPGTAAPGANAEYVYEYVLVVARRQS